MGLIGVRGGAVESEWSEAEDRVDEDRDGDMGPRPKPALWPGASRMWEWDGV